ncbi:MAG: hypothetical protein L3J59_10405 [Methylococcaceae bacterium]|nr:hypothetical protein [Methylococcaceae bacterium]
MHISELSSVGWLHNADKSIALTICLKSQIQPVFVSISREEFNSVGGSEGINENKQIAIDFYHKYGAGREYEGFN